MNPCDIYGNAVYGNSMTGSTAYLRGMGAIAPRQTVYWDNNTGLSLEKPKTVEPPTEFQQLSNHRFHELMDRFSKLV